MSDSLSADKDVTGDRCGEGCSNWYSMPAGRTFDHSHCPSETVIASADAADGDQPYCTEHGGYICTHLPRPIASDKHGEDSA